MFQHTTAHLTKKKIGRIGRESEENGHFDHPKNALYTMKKHLIFGDIWCCILIYDTT